MTLTINGLELVFPDNATLEVSQDGKKIQISLPEQKVVEKIKVVEISGPEKIVEKIQFVEQPCQLLHYPPATTPWIQPINPQPYNPLPNWTTTGQSENFPEPLTTTFSGIGTGIITGTANMPLTQCFPDNISNNLPDNLTGLA